MKHINQRQSPRIDIRLQCQVTSQGLDGPATMLTENISRTGILVVWDASPGKGAPEVGQLVTVEIELPAHHGFGRKCIHCQAVVVRVRQPEEGFPRVALNVNYMKFRAFRDDISTAQGYTPAAVGSWVS
ncbi:MAG TPA: PilZ domain-containing protein [Bryobacteraceae bacterium]|nr:PilZ domain-containing protein [Bryobacteraceae bacterium]